VEESPEVFLQKSKSPLLTILHKIIPTLLVFNSMPLLISSSITSTSKIQFGKLNGVIHPNLN